MQADDPIAQVRAVLQRFQEGYTDRDLSRLDDFMELLAAGADTELIGIGASVRGGNEWFEGSGPIREIIQSDWEYWGDVRIDVEAAKITIQGDVAWLSTSGELVQMQTFDKAMVFYLNQMKDLLDDESSTLDARLMEATHFGMRRLRERHKGEGHSWPFVFTAVLVRVQGSWRFHTIHWSMPVD